MNSSKLRSKSVLFKSLLVGVALCLSQAQNSLAGLNTTTTSTSISANTSAISSITVIQSVMQAYFSAPSTMLCGGTGIDFYANPSSTFGCLARNQARMKNIAMISTPVIVGRPVGYTFKCKDGLGAHTCNSQAFLFYNGAADFSQVQKTAYTNEDDPNWNTTGVNITLSSDFAN